MSPITLEGHLSPRHEQRRLTTSNFSIIMNLAMYFFFFQNTAPKLYLFRFEKQKLSP